MSDMGTTPASPLTDATEALSELRDPFRADCCERITMWIRKDWHGSVVFEAKVAFENGPTKGEHDIQADSFPSLVRKVELFTASLTK